VEPYAGGASVALSLLFEDFVDHIHINDIDRSVYCFWQAVLEEPDELCGRIIKTKVTMKEWERQRAVQVEDRPFMLDLAFSTFFLNRTNRSGIISGGVIGGKDQQGAWKLDARYNVTELVHRIQKIARFRSRITLSGLDAVKFLQPWIAKGASPSLIYLDPPYYSNGEGLYENFYTHEHHVEVADTVRSLQHPWIVSYDAVVPVLRLYRAYSLFSYSLSYSAANRYEGPEIMFFDHSLRVPDVESPAGISVNVVEEHLSAG
jgi:DNA adenine methylase